MALVFKVKFQDTFRRWVASETLNAVSCPITFVQLEAKIRELYQFSSSTSLAITYVDKDNDVVTVADDEDLMDACMVQGLNPLRLDVQVVGTKSNVSENFNIEAFLNALFPQATADAVKGFLCTYTPFIDPKLPIAAFIGKLEDSFKVFLDSLDARRHNQPQVSEKSVPHQTNVHPCLAMSTPHPGETTLHWGVTCDGCGMSPIEGSRFKSVKEFNHDLCLSCFKTIGNDDDYEMVDQSALPPPHHGHYRPPCFRKGRKPFSFGSRPSGPYGWKPNHSHQANNCSEGEQGEKSAPFFLSCPNHCPEGEQGEKFAPISFGCRSSRRGYRGPYGWKPSYSCAGHQFGDDHKKLDARFVKDLTIFDGTELAPGTKFKKIWRMSNIGTLPWPQSTRVVHIGGDALGSGEAVHLEVPEGGLPCGQEVEVSVDLVAPDKAGRYVSHWRLTAPYGQKFGHRVWVVIQVVRRGEHSPQLQASLQDGKNSEGAFNMDSDSKMQHGTKKGAEELAINVGIDSKLSALSIEKSLNLSTSGDMGPVVYPDPTFDDVKEAMPLDPGYDASHEVDGFSIVEVPSSRTATETEEEPHSRKLVVSEIEAMGLGHTLQSVLQNGSQWGTALKDLQEMGFTNHLTNLRLLMKHNGNVNLTVKDLVKMEKQG